MGALLIKESNPHLCPMSALTMQLPFAISKEASGKDHVLCLCSVDFNSLCIQQPE